MAALGLGVHNSGLPNSFPLSPAGRGSMVLYRLADEGKEKDGLPPPNSRFLGLDKSTRVSVVSSSGSSFVSLADSKYPGGAIPSVRGLIPYRKRFGARVVDTGTASSTPQAPVTGSVSFPRHMSRSDGFNPSSSTSIHRSPRTGLHLFR